MAAAAVVRAFACLQGASLMALWKMWWDHQMLREYRRLICGFAGILRRFSVVIRARDQSFWRLPDDIPGPPSETEGPSCMDRPKRSFSRLLPFEVVA